MSYRPLRTLEQVSRAGLFLQITCPACGRRAIYRAAEFRIACRINTELTTLAAMLVCRGAPNTKEGCGHRGAQILPIDWPPIDAPPGPPKPVAASAPRGIDPDKWAKADAAERRRLVRQARG